MKVGKYSYGNPKIYWQESGAILEIGNFSSIASEVSFFLGGNHRSDWITTYPFGHIHRNVFDNFDGAGHPSTKGDIIIGNSVWIAHGATVMSGVTIGDGVVIGAYSVVTKDVPPFCLVVGNPGRVVKKLFTEDQIEKLLKIKWWNWDDSKINEEISLLCSDRIDEFINKHYVD